MKSTQVETLLTDIHNKIVSEIATLYRASNTAPKPLKLKNTVEYSDGAEYTILSVFLDKDEIICYNQREEDGPKGWNYVSTLDTGKLIGLCQSVEETTGKTAEIEIIIPTEEEEETEEWGPYTDMIGIDFGGGEKVAVYKKDFGDDEAPEYFGNVKWVNPEGIVTIEIEADDIRKAHAKRVKII